MAATFYGKARTLALSVAHSLLDRAIDLNSVEAVRQNIRDFETSVETLENNQATHRGLLRGLTRDLVELRARKTSLNEQVETLLTDNDPTNDHHAATLEAELMGVEPILADKEAEERDMNGTIETMAKTLSQMKAVLATRKNQLSRLGSMEHAAGAKESAAVAMRQAKNTMSTGVDASVDSVAARLQKRYDIADEQLKAASDGFTTVVQGDAGMATVAARLAKRQAELAARKTTTSTLATPASR